MLLKVGFTGGQRPFFRDRKKSGFHFDFDFDDDRFDPPPTAT